MARKYGHNHVCLILKLDYYSLKERLATNSTKPRPAPVPAFVELLPEKSDIAGRCTIECETIRGERIRIHLQGRDLSELRSFCSEMMEL